MKFSLLRRNLSIISASRLVKKDYTEFREVLDMTKQEVKRMTEQVKVSNQKRIWVDGFDEEDWKALFMTELEELFEYDKDYLRVF
jgi:hypothetical protein